MCQWLVIPSTRKGHAIDTAANIYGHIPRSHPSDVAQHQVHYVTLYAHRSSSGHANAGCTHEEIAFRQRWNSDCIKLYLHDCYKMIGAMMSLAVTGAYVTIS